MKIILNILIIMLSCNIGILAQMHFPPIEPTGESYHIVVTNATVNDSPLAPGSEIGVFDDTLCVGSSLFEGNYNLDVVAWEESDIAGLPGYVTGHRMRFKLWTETDSGWCEISAIPEYELGDGLFGTGAYSVVSLSAGVTSVESEPERNKTEIKIFPNPAIGQLNISINPDKKLNESDYSLSVYNIVGDLIYEFDEENKKGNIFTWQGTNSAGVRVVSGIYLLRYVSKENIIAKKFLFIK